MIKLIIFDLSAVCFKSEEPIFMKQFAAKHGINYQKLDDYYQSWLVKAEVDEMTATELWEKVLGHFNIEGEDINKIIEDMMGIRQPSETLEVVKKLKQNFKTAYLTNYNRQYWEINEKNFDMTPYFDYGLVSFQIKARKPDIKGFKMILEEFGIMPSEAVFTDDSEKNLVNAKELGINVIHFKDSVQFLRDLGKLDVVIE